MQWQENSDKINHEYYANHYHLADSVCERQLHEVQTGCEPCMVPSHPEEVW